MNQINIHFKKEFFALFKSYAILVFSSDWRVGVVLWSLSFVHWQAGVFALSSYLIALVFKKIFRLESSEQAENAEPFIMYNSILMGLTVGYWFEMSVLTWMLVFALSILTMTMSVFLKKFFSV